MTATELIQIITGFLGSLGFAILYNIRGKKLIAASLGGFFSWTLYILLGFGIQSEALRYFLVALLLSGYAELMAKLFKTPTTTFVIISLIPLIPGGSLYYTMASVFESDLNLFLDNAVHTLELAMALALGIVATSAIAKMVRKKG
ncbi:MAG: threonine/serine exporter family protein [Clostridia bacterium]|nr:threonine/serine exporter family protein [Clostridia bacterium]